MEVSNTQSLPADGLDGVDLGRTLADPVQDAAQDTGKRGLAASGGIIGALLTSACCIIPLVLFTLGISGAWISNLTALYPYKLYFLSMTVLFLGAGFYMTYRKKNVACETGSYCATRTSDRVLKVALWGATVLVIIAMAFPYAVPYLTNT